MNTAVRRGSWVLAALLGALTVLPPARGADAPPPPGPFRHVRVVDFPGPIAALLAAYVDRQATAAEEDGVDCLVLRIESPGGTVVHSQEIGDRLLALSDDIHVIAWVPKEAYSGAAMVALACDEIVLGRDAHLGDAQPITLSPEGGIKPVGEKMESPLRAKFRAYAERNGHPGALAEAMVSARVEVLRVRDTDGGLHYVRGQDYRDAADDAEIVPGFTKAELVQEGPPVVREDELLTVTAKEAVEYGFTDRTFEDGAPFPEDEAAFLESLTAPGGKVEKVELTFSERASRWLLNIAGVLSALVALALLVTMFQGIGTITLLGGIALVLVVLINATADQLHGFPLFLIGLGAILMAVEVFLLPGFGIAGILGIGALGAGFLFLALGVSPADPGNFEFDRDLAARAIDFGLQFVLTVLGGVGLLLLLSRWFPSIGPGRRMMLAAPGGPPVSPVRESLGPTVAVGMRGRAATALRPAGSVEIDGRLVDVVTDGAYVDRGTPVVVVAVEGNAVTVRGEREEDA